MPYSLDSSRVAVLYRFDVIDGGVGEHVLEKLLLVRVAPLLPLSCTPPVFRVYGLSLVVKWSLVEF